MAKTRMTARTGSTMPALHTNDDFESLVNSISDGIFAVDSEWRLVCFNSAAERTTGMSREQAIGRRCSEVFQADSCEGACALKRTMETGQPVVNLAAQIRNAQGKRVPVTISTAVLKDSEGRVIGGVETFRDLRFAKELAQESNVTGTRGRIITQDLRMLQILGTIPSIAASDSTVLIGGESGTGKGLLAQTIHRKSLRGEGPLVTLNCGALPEPLLESELFGYKRGAFTGAIRDRLGRVAAAQGGTLFLDEICDLPLSLQVKILRLLQERTYEPLGDNRSVEADIRIVAASNRDLGKLLEKQLFREDLYYRINVIGLNMPPLRERIADIPLLAEAFLRRLSATRGKVVNGITQEALERLASYGFPGNVRELENILEHAFVLCPDRRIGANELPEWFLAKVPEVRPGQSTKLGHAEVKLIREVLARNGWNRLATARELGIHKTTLHRKIRRLGIELPPLDGRSSKARLKTPR
ncbi:MAG: PAS domain-containing protein [bacterium]|nr:PAS domain-containing protein [bacterium]